MRIYRSTFLICSFVTLFLRSLLCAAEPVTPAPTPIPTATCGVPATLTPIVAPTLQPMATDYTVPHDFWDPGPDVGLEFNGQGQYVDMVDEISFPIQGECYPICAELDFTCSRSFDTDFYKHYDGTEESETSPMVPVADEVAEAGYPKWWASFNSGGGFLETCIGTEVVWKAPPQATPITVGVYENDAPGPMTGVGRRDDPERSVDDVSFYTAKAYFSEYIPPRMGCGWFITINGDHDLLWFYIVAEMKDYLSDNDYKVTVHVPGNLRMWKDAARTQEITDGTEMFVRDLYQNDPYRTPRDFYLDAITPSSKLMDGTFGVILHLDSGTFYKAETKTTVLKMDLDCDADNDGAIEEEDDPIEMDSPGMLIERNSPEETHPREIVFTRNPADIGKIVFTVSDEDMVLVKVGNDIIDFPYTLDLETGPAPTTITAMVEGLAVGSVTFKAEWKIDGTVMCEDQVKCSIIALDVDVDSDNDSVISMYDPTEEIIEMNEPGKLVFLNRDDDNANDISDLTEQARSANENDFALLTIMRHGPSVGTIELGTPGQSNHYRIWRQTQQGYEIQQLPVVINPEDGDFFYLEVEGIDIGSIELTATWYLGERTLATDGVLLNVMDVEFQKRDDTAYGYDDGTNTDSPVPLSSENPPQLFDAVSLDYDSKTTDVDVVITPSEFAQYVYFYSAVPLMNTAAPTQAVTSPQKVTIASHGHTGHSLLRTCLGTVEGAGGDSLRICNYEMRASVWRYYRIVGPGLEPQDLDVPSLQDAVNSILNQGVSRIVISSAETVEVDYDLPLGQGNGYLDIPSGQHPELDIIENELQYPQGEKIIIHASKIRAEFSGQWLTLAGMLWGDKLFLSDTADNIPQTLAHELLHSWALADTGPEGSNVNHVMYYTDNDQSFFLGYFKVEKVIVDQGVPGVPTGTYENQWDTIVRDSQ